MNGGKGGLMACVLTEGMQPAELVLLATNRQHHVSEHRSDGQANAAGPWYNRLIRDRTT